MRSVGWLVADVILCENRTPDQLPHAKASLSHWIEPCVPAPYSCYACAGKSTHMHVQLIHRLMDHPNCYSNEHMHLLSLYSEQLFIYSNMQYKL